MDDYITPKYETIGAEEKRKIIELCQSTLLNAFTLDDYLDIICVFSNVIDRLEEQDNVQ